MGLQLLFLLVKLHLVICTPQLHQFPATNQHNSRIRSHSSNAFPPSKLSSGIPASIAIPPSKAFSPSQLNAPKRKWEHSSVGSQISNNKHHYYSRRKSNNQLHVHQGPPLFRSQSPTNWDFHAPAPSPAISLDNLNAPSPPPRISSQGSSFRKTKSPSPPYVLVLPPPPLDKGLPSSPPSSVSGMDFEPNSDDGNNGTMVKPLGVEVSRKKKEGSNGRFVIMIVLSSFTAFVLLIGVAWLCLIRCGSRALKPEQVPDVIISSSSKRSGAAISLSYGSMPGSRSMSFNSGTITYTGSAKVFTLNEIEIATENFNSSRILGEGGFGLVYKGNLYDGRDVAVKILKREDQHGAREFLAEVEMLSRLHHRNLVKLIGICIEKQTRCLVYELVPNGSVESHLHGADKETDPLDWDARMKIALGAARGLGYLHEDSSPCVIHRDFKSSNILLDYDFTPKVSDFGLARTTMEEGNKSISTYVMGTFGYLAPEYAMTGHLLVKSDVYSYGVVLLELLTGRKPVDLSQPQGQENLVAWVRPLLTSKESLENIIDPVIKGSISLDSMVKVAAIASMCVQPEATQRPFMGEVVQALKLVCNDL